MISCENQMNRQAFPAYLYEYLKFQNNSFTVSRNKILVLQTFSYLKKQTKKTPETNTKPPTLCPQDHPIFSQIMLLQMRYLKSICKIF